MVLNTKVKKSELLNLLNEFYEDGIKKYESKIKQIILIQKVFRGYKLRKYDIHRGPGYFNLSLCKNDEDFFNMESLDTIPKQYLFTYKDILNNVWGFDIRSLKQLIDKEVLIHIIEEIPFSVKSKVNKLLKYLDKNNYEIVYEQQKLTPEQEFKNKVLSVFQKIDNLNVTAGGTDIKWFTNLTIYQLKNFYKHLEDIWNYRAELTKEKQLKIVPNDDVLKYPILFINKINNFSKLQTLI